MRRILFACVLLGRLPAQSLTGVVVDETGAAIPNAEITVSQQPSRVAVTGVRTREDGSFRILDLDAGVYEMKISRAGFKDKIVEGSSRRPANETNIGQVKLELGEILNCPSEQGIPRVNMEKTSGSASSLTGYVYIPYGLPTGMVRISLKPLSGNRPILSTMAEKYGPFDFDHVEPGIYILRASAPSFVDFVIDRIEIQAGAKGIIGDPLTMVPCIPGAPCPVKKTTELVNLCM